MASGQDANIRFVCVGKTDVGRVREHNEDNFLVVDLAADKRGTSGELLTGPVGQRGLSLVVADGMGGAAAGEVASQMAVDMLHGEFKNADLGGTVRTEQNVIALLEGAINKANEAIFKKGQESKDHQGMGTTLTAAVVLGDSFYLSQVGDSRGYLLRKGKLVQMTRDQSLIGQLIEEGTLTEEQAEKLGGKNIILQALGVEESLKIDSKRYDVLRGDTLLLCSDGLSGMVPDPKIEEILAGEADLAKAAPKLIEAANAGGGKDNITCILARFEGEGLREPLSPLTDAERAGGSFHAPPPPKSKAGRNAVIGTAAILGIGAIVLLLPKDVQLKVTARPVAGTITVRGAAEGGPDGFQELKEPFQPDVPVVFKLKRGKRFEVVVEAPGYREQKRPVSTEVETIEVPEGFELVRIPAKSLDLVPPPYRGKPLSRVKARLVPSEKQKADDKPIEAKDDPADPEFAKEFPAGKWEVRVERDGFQPGKAEFEAKSDEVARVDLHPLEESFGDLAATDLPPGAAVTVFDQEEGLLEKPAPVHATRSTGPLKVRATEVIVKAAREGYEFQPQRAKVEKDKETTVSFAGSKGIVHFQAPDGGSLRLKGPGTVRIPFDGKPQRRTVDPGTYKATYTKPNGDEVEFEVVVEPGQILPLREL